MTDTLTPEPPADALRIVTYNVRYFGHGTRGLASTPGAMMRIAASLASLRPLPDILCLQEVETLSLRSELAYRATHRAEVQPKETQLQRFVRSLHGALRAQNLADTYDGEYFRAHDYSIREITSVYTTGLAVLVRRPLRFVEHNSHLPMDITHRGPTLLAAESAAMWLKQRRICAHAIVALPTGVHLDVFNTHLSLPSFLHSKFWTQPYRLGWGNNQLEEAKKLRDFVEQQRSSDRFVLVGDLNSLPRSPVDEFLTATASWNNALAIALHHDVTALRKFPTAGFLHLRMHLDHIFFGSGFQCIDVDGTLPFGDPKNLFHGLSDHIPIVGRFTLGQNDAIEVSPS